MAGFLDYMFFVDALNVRFHRSPMNMDLGAKDGCGEGSRRMRLGPCLQELMVWSSHNTKGKGCVRETGVHEGFSVIDSGEGDATLGWSLQGKIQGWRKAGTRVG